ncbi:MAG TPA: bifunctional riboflavin kinase/FAD synthetase [Clostridia bacterium]|jgi:riboflavin kinase/FMN adenylyltransferase|nr:bifunctional riboflavin kinase/FAD synthetase [Clostridia bacterium]HQC68962.1 bifunctional riboflavin kinase/FAD synthetase [Clostridia bacterium]
MKIIKSEDNYKFEKKNVIALGNFDGLHIAHRKLIETAVSIAKKNNLFSLVYIFDIHPLAVLANTKQRFITDIEQKLELIGNMGVDFVYLQKFDYQFSRMQPERFIADILKERLSCEYAISGYDYKFGYMAEGDIKTLKNTGGKYDIKVKIQKRIDYLGQPVSASRIRELLAIGDIQYVNNLLGREYQIRGTVEKGKSIGSKIGYPTANIPINDDMQIPAFGVYRTVTSIDGIRYASITNIGNNPTVNDKNTDNITCETHLVDKSGLELYGKKIYIDFIKMIRKEQKYPDIEALKKAIAQDILLVKSYYK